MTTTNVTDAADEIDECPDCGGDRNAGDCTCGDEIGQTTVSDDSEEDAGGLYGSDDDDEIWETSTDIDDDPSDPGPIHEQIKKPVGSLLSSIALQGVSSHAKKRPIANLDDAWLRAAYARMTGLLSENPDAGEAPEWKLDVRILTAAAEARGLDLFAEPIEASAPTPRAKKAGVVALAAREPTAADINTAIVPVPLSAIEPDPAQARDEGADDELAESIAANGVLQPIELRRSGKAMPQFIIVDGERRYRGALKAGLKTIRATVTEMAEEEGERLLRQVVRNDGKRLKPMEEARTFKRIMADKGWNIAQLAQHLGKSKSTVSDRVAILDAPAAFHPLFAAGVFTAAAAPLVRPYKDVPADILERLVADLSKDELSDFVATETAVPLREVEEHLRQLTYQYARKLDPSVAKHYEGPTCTISRVQYATDIPAYETARTASYNRPASSSAAEDRYEQQAAEKRRKENAAQKKRLADRRAQFAAISARLPGSIGGSVNQAAGWAELLVELIMKEVQQDTLRLVAGQLHLVTTKSRNGGMGHYGDAVKKYARGLDAGGRVKLALQLLIASDLSQPPYISGGPERFQAVAKLLKLDLKKVKPVEPEFPVGAKKIAHALHAPKPTKKARR